MKKDIYDAKININITNKMKTDIEVVCKTEEITTAEFIRTAIKDKLMR
jgi:hypothetical protein